jgi:hypothetical protein
VTGVTGGQNAVKDPPTHLVAADDVLWLAHSERKAGQVVGDKLRGKVQNLVGERPVGRQGPAPQAVPVETEGQEPSGAALAQ